MNKDNSKLKNNYDKTQFYNLYRRDICLSIIHSIQDPYTLDLISIFETNLHNYFFNLYGISEEKYLYSKFEDSMNKSLLSGKQTKFKEDAFKDIFETLNEIDINKLDLRIGYQDDNIVVYRKELGFYDPNWQLINISFCINVMELYRKYCVGKQEQEINIFVHYQPDSKFKYCPMVDKMLFNNSINMSILFPKNNYRLSELGR